MTQTTVSLTVEHEGVSYHGEIGRISSTSLGFEDHGIMTSYLHLDFGGSGQGAGGYGLDRSTGADCGYKRAGTAYGLDYIIRTLEVVGVRTWEDLKDERIIALYETRGGLIRGIASLDGKRVLIYAKHAKKFIDG